MKTISSIYSHCLTSLNDDWLSSPEGNGDLEEGAMKEINLRMLTRLYNGQRYLPNILPKLDEDQTLFYSNGYNTEDLKTKLIDDIELDLDFKNDYRSWLETTIYSKETEAENENDDGGDDDDDDDDDDDQDETNSVDNENENTWHIGTPLPDTLPVPLSSEDLTREINKLYIEELQREFNQSQQKQQQLASEVEDGWDKPTPTTNSWFESNNGDTIVNNDDTEEIEPEVDPLQGINWENLTEEELKKRLTLVEKKTVQRWLNIDMDDPRYIKVLNTFEGEILEDEEGWPIY
jgi:hypothetical protein